MASQVARVQSSTRTLGVPGSVPILIYALSAAAAADLVTLFRNIPILGLGAEVNPVTLYFLVNFGPWGLIAAKGAAVLFASFVGLSLARNGRIRLARVTLSICCIATLLAALTNILSV